MSFSRIAPSFKSIAAVVHVFNISIVLFNPSQSIIIEYHLRFISVAINNEVIIPLVPYA